MATYRFRTKYGLKISDSHKKSHGEYLTRWADEINRNPNMLNYTYSDSYAILNYVNDNIVQFTKEEQQALRYKFNYWKKKKNQKAAVKEHQERAASEPAAINSKEVTKPAATKPKETTNATAKPTKPEDHGNITRTCLVYHPDYGKGVTGEYISENGKAKVFIIFGEGGPGTGSGLYSLAQLKAAHNKWYFGTEAVAKAEAYYEAQKKAKAALKEKIMKKQGKKAKATATQSADTPVKIKLGQVIYSNSTGKGVVTDIYKDENDINRVKVKYSFMTMSYRMSELTDSEHFTIIDEIKNIAPVKPVVQEPAASSKPVSEAKHETEIIKQTPDRQETTVHEQIAASQETVAEAIREPRKDYHRKLNSQEAAIADTVVRYVRNMPSEKQNEYGSSIQSTSEEFAKANNIPTPPPIQTAAVKARRKSRLVNISSTAEQSNETELARVREVNR